LKEQIKIPGNW